jgi:succinate dehydrogenase/fumarate reductase flavoprotein subunit
MGGNSTKATSGINGAGTQTQQDHGIVDSAKIFFDDTKRSVRVIRSRFLLNAEFLHRPVISRAMTSSKSSLAAQATR